MTSHKLSKHLTPGYAKQAVALFLDHMVKQLSTPAPLSAFHHLLMLLCIYFLTYFFKLDMC
jgi:hypothetical protein